jgi:4-hydroxybenzoate polyprenyltransferase
MSDPTRPEFEPLNETETQSAPRSPILPWLRLMRLPNVFTAIADVAMGYLFVHRAVDNVGKFACLIAASATLYTAGMVLNDLFDLEIDAKERPFRPLPSGQISVPAARALGFALLAIGVVLGWLAGFLPGPLVESPRRSGLIASALAACVVAYDTFLKKTPLGPIGMGACRFLNVLLGMSVGPAAVGGVALGYGPGELLAAVGIGLYIVGVTWFSRSEAGVSRGVPLLAAMTVIAGGVAFLGASALYVRIQVNYQLYWLLLAVLMLTVMRRCGAAAIDPASEKVQAAVKHSILSLIWLDAATATAAAGPVYGVAIAALLIPALLLGRWVYST